MNRYSPASEARLQTCDERIQRVLRSLLPEFDHSILEGHRGESEQNEAFRTGASKVEWPNGKHNKMPSKAVDVAPANCDLTDKRNIPRICYFAGRVMGRAVELGVRLRWGGDWDGDNELRDQTFNDLVHFEVID